MSHFFRCSHRRKKYPYSMAKFKSFPLKVFFKCTAMLSVILHTLCQGQEGIGSIFSSPNTLPIAGKKKISIEDTVKEKTVILMSKKTLSSSFGIGFLFLFGQYAFSQKKYNGKNIMYVYMFSNKNSSTTIHPFKRIF